MQPNNQPGRPDDQQMQHQSWSTPRQDQPTSHQQSRQAPRSRPVSESEVSTPTLQWVQISSTQEQVALGDDDYILDSYFNPQLGTWEVLVIVKPIEGSEDEEEE